MDREAQLIRVIVSVSLSIPILLGFALAARDARWVPIVAGLVGVAIAAHVAIGALSRRDKPVKWLLSLSAVSLVLVVPEFTLHLVRFNYQPGIQFGYPEPSDFVLFEPDPELFWKLKPSRSDVNSWGFPGPEIELPKPVDTVRIVFLGDSVTQQGYPEYVAHFLNARRADPSQRFESVSLAVAGYTSHQGRAAAEIYGARVDADLVVVFFGWNDHWRAHGFSDSRKPNDFHAPGSGLASWLRVRLRVLQALGWSVDRLTSRSREPLEQVRVPIEQYRDNLEAIHRAFAGLPLVFVTAPTSHYRTGVPDYLVEKDFVIDKPWTTRIHREYNDVVRELAPREGVALLDLEASFDVIPSATFDAIFMEDGIHLTPVGVAIVADELAGVLDEMLPR